MPAYLRVLCVVIVLCLPRARADQWSHWAQVHVNYTEPNTPFGFQLACDGTNLFYSTLLNGVYEASLADGYFYPLPMNGFPSWDAYTNTDGYAAENLIVAPQGTLLLSGAPVTDDANGFDFVDGSVLNTLPVFYWWDTTNQVWQPATVTGKTYAYTTTVGNFCNAPDGSVWACSGFASYAYRSTDDGHSYVAYASNARVPAIYFPIPFSGGLMTFGKVFSIAAGKGQVVIGCEGGGYLHTTNNGTTWTSLDPNFTNPASVNPLGRSIDAAVAGLDHYGNFLCGNSGLAPIPGYTNWSGATLIGWHPADGSYFNASTGFPPGYGPAKVVTATASGETFTFMDQDFSLQGGVYRSQNGKSWSQFNQGSSLSATFAPGLTNARAPGNCITLAGTLVFIGAGANSIYVFDSTPPPITNRPPVALPQNLNITENTATNFTLAGYDADGDALNFTLVTAPRRGTLTGIPPALTYTPATNTTRLDSFAFAVDDGITTSAPVLVNIAINAPTNALSTVAFTSPANGALIIGPTNVTLTLTASNPSGVSIVSFYSTTGTNLNPLASLSSAPYTFVLTNLATGSYTFSANVSDNHGARTWSAPVSIDILPEIPRVSVQQLDSANVAVSWPLDLDGFYVEVASDPQGPWTLSPVPPILYETNQTATLPMAGQQFFRLMRPQ